MVNSPTNMPLSNCQTADQLYSVREPVYHPEKKTKTHSNQSNVVTTRKIIQSHPSATGISNIVNDPSKQYQSQGDKENSQPREAHYLQRQ